MTITHDPELPWAVINPGNDKVVARFEEKGDAEQFLNTTYGYTLKNTSPAPTAAGVYAITMWPGVRHSRHFLLTINGEWFWLDFTAERGNQVLEATTEEVVARYELTPKWVEA